MNDDDPKSDAYMPICHVCGNPMKLIGLRAKLMEIGLPLPNDEELFVIQCCGHALTIDDPERATGLLQIG